MYFTKGYTSLHKLAFPSLTRCGTTAVIDHVCERVTSESSVLLNVTHGEVQCIYYVNIIIIINDIIINDFIVRNENSKILFAQLIVGPAATEQRQIDVALSLSNVERQTG